MAPDPKGNALQPVSPTRAAKELAHLSQMAKDGELDKDEYEHRFARMVSELRERRISGTRQEILAALQPLVGSGLILPAEFERFTRQLGLA